MRDFQTTVRYFLISFSSAFRCRAPQVQLAERCDYPSTALHHDHPFDSNRVRLCVRVHVNYTQAATESQERENRIIPNPGPDPFDQRNTAPDK